MFHYALRKKEIFSNLFERGDKRLFKQVSRRPSRQKGLDEWRSKKIVRDDGVNFLNTCK